MSSEDRQLLVIFPSQFIPTFFASHSVALKINHSTSYWNFVRLTDRQYNLILNVFQYQMISVQINCPCSVNVWYLNGRWKLVPPLLDSLLLFVRTDGLWFRNVSCMVHLVEFHFDENIKKFYLLGLHYRFAL